MMNIVAHNLLAMNANRQFGIVNKKKAKSTEKLSSGYKINRAADDAAGLSISEKMRRQIRGLHKAEENIQDGISLCQVADGALNETHDILQRMNELAVKAGNDTNSQTDRAFIQTEIDALTEEIDRIANQTTFNEEIYPLLGESVRNVGGYPGGDITEKPDVKPLSDSDYPGSNLQIVNASTISNYASYVDGNGKKHYQLESGTFKIDELTNCVFDISGNSCIEDSDLKNVTINCNTGAILSVKNVKIDNSAYITRDSGGIGAAIDFKGKGNVLNCYGINEFNGGIDCYTEFTDYQPGSGSSPYLPCAGVHVGKDTELQINGTDTSGLEVHACRSEEGYTYVAGRKVEAAGNVGSYAIGSNFHEDGGSIIINSGSINAYSGIDYKLYGWSGCIGGGNNTNVIINGGNIKAYSGSGPCIGGGDTFGDSQVGYGTANISIYGGDIYCYGYRGSAVLGYEGMGSVNIYDGNVEVYTDQANACIGNGSGDCSSTSSVNIYGGMVTAINDTSSGVGIGAASGSKTILVNVNITGGTIVAKSERRAAIGTVGRVAGSDTNVKTYVDKVLTDAYGIKEDGYNTYTYSNPSGGNIGDGGENPDDGWSSGNFVNRGIWIHTTTEPGVGMFIDLVNATAKGIGIENLDMSSMENAGNAINSIKGAIEKVSRYRNVFGSQQNRLEHAMRVNANIAENTTDAESRIRDTDVAEEMVTFSNENILAQAGQSMLSQANQSQQYILNLLS